ncbi:DUF3137 domain-containing protein [Aquibacillus halophilus]|uniref:DUF3137 domain-containing protein n=1 Tax=Aquibacillus halophilus TaxID=930132 RepID=UPI001478CAC2
MQKISKTKEEFDQFFDERLSVKIEQLEENREAVKKNRNKQLLVIGLVMLPPIVLTQIIDQYALFFFIIAFAILIFGVFKLSKTYQAFTGVMKQEITQEIVTFINPDFRYEPKEYIPESKFIDSNIFVKKPDKYRGDDLIWGYVYDHDVSNTDKNPELVTHGAKKENESLEQVQKKFKQDNGNSPIDETPRTKISFSEVEAIDVQSRPGEGSNTHEEAIFKGLFFDVDFNKDFEGVTIILPRNNVLFDFKKIERTLEQPELDEIELDNIEFSERFTVMTSDEVKARYILTPAFMNKILSFVDITKERVTERPQNKPANTNSSRDKRRESRIAKRLIPYFSFKEGKMYFLLNTSQLHFEFNMDKKPDKESLYYDFQDINQSLELVEELDLNLKLWNKS